MLQLMPASPRRVLMTLDAVGGVWRYAIDLAAALKVRGVETVFAGFGPRPGLDQMREADAVGELYWVDLPLDWMASGPEEIQPVARAIERIADTEEVDVLHLNQPSQAAGLSQDRPVVVVAHSCVPSWFRVVRGGGAPQGWEWHQGANQAGFARADQIAAPSRSFATLLQRCYPGLPAPTVVPNCGAEAGAWSEDKQPYVYAAARWWDEGKSGDVLDAAAGAVGSPVFALGETAGPQGQVFSFAHVRHLGQKTHRELRKFARQASIFVSPSVYEPFGLAALEAAQSGAAMILSDIPTYREFWDDAALFVTVRQPETLARAIEQLAADDGLRRKLAGKARERAAALSPARQAEAMLALYADAGSAAARSLSESS